MADPIVTGAELATPGIPDAPPRADPPPAVVEAAPPAPTPTEPVTAAPPVDPPKEVPATVAETPSLLEAIKVPGAEEPAKETKVEEPAKVEEKSAEKPAEQKAEEKPAEAPKVEPEKPAPVEYKYELGDDLVLNDERRGEFHGVLDAYRADPANVQPLIDFHRKTMADYAQAVSDRQHKVFNDTRAGWNKEIMSDEQLGGSGFETTKIAVARARDMLTSDAPVGSEQYRRDQLAVDQFMRVTGAGDHPVFWKMLHNASRRILERDSSEIPHEGITPPADNARGPNTRQNRRALIYNHPTSPNNRNG